VNSRFGSGRTTNSPGPASRATTPSGPCEGSSACVSPAARHRGQLVARQVEQPRAQHRRERRADDGRGHRGLHDRLARVGDVERLHEQLGEVEAPRPRGAQRRGEAVVLLLRAGHPRQPVEQQVGAVARREPLQLRAGPVEHDVRSRPTSLLTRECLRGMPATLRPRRSPARTCAAPRTTGANSRARRGDLCRVWASASARHDRPRPRPVRAGRRLTSTRTAPRASSGPRALRTSQRARRRGLADATSIPADHASARREAQTCPTAASRHRRRQHGLERLVGRIRRHGCGPGRVRGRLGVVAARRARCRAAGGRRPLGPPGLLRRPAAQSASRRDRRHHAPRRRRSGAPPAAVRSRAELDSCCTASETSGGSRLRPAGPAISTPVLQLGGQAGRGPERSARQVERSESAVMPHTVPPGAVCRRDAAGAEEPCCLGHARARRRPGGRRGRPGTVRKVPREERRRRVRRGARPRSHARDRVRTDDAPRRTHDDLSAPRPRAALSTRRDRAPAPPRVGSRPWDSWTARSRSSPVQGAGSAR
jgi:hypothetical protein